LRYTGEGHFYERRQISLDVNDWTDIDEVAKARGQTAPRMLRELIEIILHDGLIDAIFDDDGEHKRHKQHKAVLPLPPTPSVLSAAFAPRLIATTR
jgi:hypothetical protein